MKRDTAVSSSASNLELPDREQLVAYLDGELPPEESAAVEQRLASDAEFRGEMQQLAWAWDALDELPPPAVDDSFAATTMELIAVRAEQDLVAQTAALPARRRRRRGFVVLALALVTMLGFLAGSLAWPDPNQALLDDLQVIQRVDLLTQAGSVEFLRLLEAKFGPQLAAMDDAAADQLASQIGDVAEDRSSGRQQVAALNEEDQRALKQRYRRFDSLPADERERIRKLHRQIADQQDADRLEAVLIQYGVWLQSLPAGDQAALRGLATRPRIERVGQLLARERRDAMQLSPEEVGRVRAAMVEFVSRHRDELRRRVPPYRRREFQELRDQRTALRLLLTAMWTGRARHGEFPLKLRGEFMRIIRQAVSSTRWQDLDDLPPQQRSRVMQQWLRQALAPPQMTNADLEAFFASDALTNQRREELLLLPVTEMEQRLRRQYMQTTFDHWLDDAKPSRMGPNTELAPRNPRGPAGSPRRDRRRGEFRDRPMPPPRRGPPD